MRAHEPMRPHAGRRIRVRVAGAVLVAAAVLGACTGENLFTGLAGVTQLLGPDVDITAPQAGLTLAVGDSVQVGANITSQDGVTEVAFSGLFQAGGAAFVSEIVPLPSNPMDTTVAEFLIQVDGAGTGNVNLIVEATDVLGQRGADTVQVSIN